MSTNPVNTSSIAEPLESMDISLSVKKIALAIVLFKYAGNNMGILNIQDDRKMHESAKYRVGKCA